MLYPIFEDGNFKPDRTTTGEFLASAIEELDAIAEDAGLTPLSLFDSRNRDPEFIAFLETLDFDDVTEDDLDRIEEFPYQVQWFAAKDGLVTVDALLAFLAKNRKEGEKTFGEGLDGVLAELEDVKRQLRQAEKRKIAFQMELPR